MTTRQFLSNLRAHSLCSFFLAACAGPQSAQPAMVVCPQCDPCVDADGADPAADLVDTQLRAALDQFRQGLVQDALREEDEDDSARLDALVSPRSRHIQFWGMPGCCIQPVFAYEGSPLSHTAPEGWVEHLLDLLAVEIEDSGTSELARDSSSARLLGADLLPRDAMALYAMNEPQVARDFIRTTHALSVRAGSDYLYVFLVRDQGQVHVTHVVMGESME